MKLSLVFLAVFLVVVESFKLQAAVQRIIVCPTSEANATCMSLSDVATNKGKHFVSNTNVLFLPGTHELSGVLIIAGISNISLSCEWPSSKADVKCNNFRYSGFFFNRSKNITIKNINFISCGLNTLQHADSPFAALYFEKVAVFTIEHVGVLNSTGFGIIAAQISEQVIIKYSVFRGNGTYGGNAKLSFQGCSSEASSSLLIRSTEFANGSTRVSHSSGLMVDCMCPGVTIHLDKVIASNNGGGNVRFRMRDSYSWEILITRSMIIGGYGVKGSGLYFSSKMHQCNNTETVGSGSSMTIKDTHFVSNTAKKFGGGFMAKLRDSDCNPTKITLINCTFSGNTVTDPDGHGAAIKVQKYSVPRFYKHLLPLHHIQLKKGRFCDNMIQGSEGSVIEFDNIEKAAIEECQFKNNVGTAIAMTASDVIFTGNITFDNNTATNGGALRFCDSSAMFLNPKTTVVFKNNFARQVGGAIFAQEACLAVPKACFFQPIVKGNTPVANLLTSYQITLTFTNNTAASAGDAIYGGEIDNCYTYTRLVSSNRSVSYFLSSEVFNTITFGLSEEAIASEPYKVKFCRTDVDFGSFETALDFGTTIVPGKAFNIGVVAVGQRLGIAPAVITAELAGENPNAIITQTVRPTTPTKRCTYLNLTLRTIHVETTVELVLKVQGSSSKSQTSNIDRHKRNLTIFVEPCPWGFTLNKIQRECVCFITDYNCNLNTLTIDIPDNKDFIWIGCDKSSNSTSSLGLIYGHGCGSRHHCNIEVKTIPAVCVDNLCTEHRTGVLCGSCRPEWSVVLGTGRCKSCPSSNKYLGLVVLYLAAGVLLILLLTKFKLTVSNGSFNGLLFFANLIHWNQNAFFPKFYNGDILRLIISWLNLDLGIEICFFNGMTALHVIWLQIGYILYIVFLQVAIIILCRRYVIFTRFFGRNVTKVLSTLVTLLYAKALTTVVSVFTYTKIHTQDSPHFYKVLSVDGNVRFFSHQHIPLLVTASFLALFFLMFTGSLIFIQILIKASSWKLFKWVVRLQPFFETMTGPCNFNYAFWPGYLLFMRVGYVIYQSSAHDEMLRDQMYVTCGSAVTTIIFSFLGPKGVYKRWSLNILELSIMLNLAITSLLVGGKLHDKNYSGADTITRVSVGIALFSFLAYHVQSYVKFKRLKNIVAAFFAWFLTKCSNLYQQDLPPVVTRTDVTVSMCVPAEQTPLLPAAQGMPPIRRYDKLREPLVED